MTKLTKLKAEHKEIMEKVAAIQECDPRRYEQDQKDLKVCQGSPAFVMLIDAINMIEFKQYVVCKSH